MDIEYIKQKALIRILDDDEALGAALKLYLELDGWQVAVYSEARRFFAEDRPSVPGCLVLDVRMPELTGLECQRMLNERQSNIPIVFISGHGDIDMAVQTILDGAYDFLQKPVEPQRLLTQVTKAVAASIRQTNEYDELQKLVERIDKLSNREREIAKLVSQGLRNKEIARKLGIEETTVKMHRANAMAKLAANTSAELTRLFTILELKQNGKLS